MEDISEQRKAYLEEWLFQAIAGVEEFYLICRILRRIQVILKEDLEWIIQNVPAHKAKLLELKINNDFNDELNLEIATLNANVGNGDRELPTIVVEIYYRILEFCKNSKENYNWFREYVKVNGKLEKRLKSSNIKCNFNLPMVPAQSQNDTAWARSLKKDMLMKYSTLGLPVFKSHNGRTKKVMSITIANNEAYIKRAEAILLKNACELDNSSTRIINLFLPQPYQKMEDLKPLEHELNIPKGFR